MKYCVYYVTLFSTLIFVMGFYFWFFDHFKDDECFFVKEETVEQAKNIKDPNITVIEQVAPILRLLQNQVVSEPSTPKADTGATSSDDTTQDTTQKEIPTQTTDTIKEDIPASTSETEATKEPPVNTTEADNPQNNSQTDDNTDDKTEKPSTDVIKEDQKTPLKDQAMIFLEKATTNVLVTCPLLIGIIYLFTTLTTFLYCYSFSYFKSLYSKNPNNLSTPGFFAKLRGLFLKSIPPLNHFCQFVVLALIIFQVFIFYFHSGCKHIRKKNIFGEYEQSELGEIRLYVLFVFIGLWFIFEFLFSGWRNSINEYHFQHRPFRKTTTRCRILFSNLGFY